MAYWLKDSSGFSNPQNSVEQQSALKKKFDQVKSNVPLGMLKDIANTIMPSRIHSAPSTVGRVDEDNEEKKGHQIRRLSSCGDLYSKVQLKENQKDSVKPRKGVRKLFPFKKLRTRVFSFQISKNKSSVQHWRQDLKAVPSN